MGVVSRLFVPRAPRALARFSYAIFPAGRFLPAYFSRLHLGNPRQADDRHVPPSPRGLVSFETRSESVFDRVLFFPVPCFNLAIIFKRVFSCSPVSSFKADKSEMIFTRSDLGNDVNPSRPTSVKFS